MKKILLILIINVLFISNINTSINDIANNKGMVSATIEQNITVRQCIPTTVMNFMIVNKDFLYAIGHLESRNRYNITNKFGYIGKYQFNPNTISGLGYTVSNITFLNDPVLQEQIMWTYLKYHEYILQEYIDKYDNTYYHISDNDSIYITKSGILGAAHLSGAGNVIKFFKSNGKRKFADAFGTSLRKYLKELSGFTLLV